MSPERSWYLDKPGRRPPKDLVGVAEIAARARRPANTIVIWAQRHTSFPRPHYLIHGRRVWLWPDVEAWLRETGRDQLPPHRPLSRRLPSVDHRGAETWQGPSEGLERPTGRRELGQRTLTTFHEEHARVVVDAPREETGLERELRLSREADGG